MEVAVLGYDEALGALPWRPFAGERSQTSSIGVLVSQAGVRFANRDSSGTLHATSRWRDTCSRGSGMRRAIESAKTDGDR